MKRTPFKMTVLLIAIAYAMLAFSKTQSGVIRGKIMPANAASKVWAISATDTLKSNVEQGIFALTGAKPGTYKLTIEAVPPYLNTTKDGVMVNAGQTTDVGTIMLSQGK